MGFQCLLIILNLWSGSEEREESGRVEYVTELKWNFIHVFVKKFKEKPEEKQQNLTKVEKKECENALEVIQIPQHRLSCG